MTAGPAAERVLADARRLATEHRHEFVGTEHLLAALLADRGGFGATVVAAAGLEPAAVAAAVLQGLRRAPEGREAPPAVSRFADRALNAAAAAAREDGRESATDQDLVRQLVSQAKGRTAQALRGDGTALAALQGALGITAPAGAAAEAVKRAGGAPSGAGKVPREPAEKPATTDKRSTGKGGDVRGRKEPEKARGRDHKVDLTRPSTAAGPAAGTGPLAPEAPRPRRIAMPQPPRRFPWARLLLAAIPVALYLQWAGAAPGLVFLTACLAMLPLAGLMGEVTGGLAERSSPMVGGLLNATLGNATGLIIALVALRAGLVDLVKASITGSILVNLLLMLGLAFVAAGAGATTVRFNRPGGGTGAAMLALAVAGLVFPAMFHAIHGPPDPAAGWSLSDTVAVILAVTFGLSLVFSLRTKRALFGGGEHPDIEPGSTRARAIGLVALAATGIVAMAVVLVDAVDGVTRTLGLGQVFLGLIIIALGSSTQVALLITPILVLAGGLLGVRMDLVLPVFDVLLLALATGAVAITTLDGEATWFHGVQLVAVYGAIVAAVLLI